MDLVIWVIIISIFVITGIVVTVIANKTVSKSYDEKVVHVVDQLNQSFKSTYNKAFEQGKQLDKNQDTLVTTSEDILALNQKSIVNAESVFVSTNKLNKFKVENDKSVAEVEKQVGNLPYAKQVESIKTVTGNIGSAEKSTQNMAQLNVTHDTELSRMGKMATDMNQTLLNTRTNIANSQKYASDAFYSIQGAYLKKKDMADTVKNFTNKNTYDNQIATVNQSLHNLRNSIEMFPTTYSTLDTIKTLQASITKAQSDIIKLNSTVETIRSTYTSKSDIQNAINLASNADRTFANNLQNLQTSLINISSILSQLPGRYVKKKTLMDYNKLLKSLIQWLLLLEIYL
jgi:prefoldin subunit 5